MHCKDISSAASDSENTRRLRLVHCRRTKISVALYELKNGAIKYFGTVSVPACQKAIAIIEFCREGSICASISQSRQLSGLGYFFFFF